MKLFLICSAYWASFFNPRNLITYAIHPSIIMPTHYFGEPGYISDTENTKAIDINLFEAKSDAFQNNVQNIININQENYDHHIEL